MRKKRVALHSNFSLANTGFGRTMKFLLSYLYKTGKYEISEYSAGPITWSHPMCKAMPWPCYGAQPDNPMELEPFRSDPAQMTAIEYGAYNIDRFLKQQKPDVLIMTEDIWGIPYFDKPWINKFPHVFWTPIDSTPILPIFEQNKDKFGHLWVKARFAKDALAKKGIASEYYPDLIGSHEFYPLSKDQKKLIRHKYGIADNTLVFGFVFRNQLRKLVGTLIEGFSIFKKENPNVDAKLFLHTSWSDPKGWRIHDFINRFGVRREDVLTTHVCRSCRNISVRSFYGENGPCLSCKSKDSVVTCSPSIGVNEKELNELYNICTAYVHPATSGGFEMPVAEALFSGLPVAVADYSFGSNYTINPEVFNLDYSIYSEMGSQFDKSQIDPLSIAKFMQKIADLSAEERDELGNRLREWAVEEFDGNKVCERIEKFIDELPLSDYQFDFEASSDLRENYLKNVIIQNGKKRILIVEPGGLSECLNSAVFIEQLEGKYPKEEWDYYVATNYPQMFMHLPYVIKVFKHSDLLNNTLYLEGIGTHQGYFDLAFHPESIRSNPDLVKVNY